MDHSVISITDLEKDFVADNTSRCVIKNLNLCIEKKSFVCILGYTGCGKSTLLRMICGLDKPNGGHIYVNGKEHLHPTKDVVMIFQDLNQLFPWKTALENVVYAIRNTNREKKRKDARAEAMSLLREVGLEEFAQYYPHQMSGGMRQRAAVARALAIQPKILLMDEPFSALDELNRRKLQTLCRQLYEERDITILFVTHSIEESISLADQIVIMNHCDGNIVGVLDNICRLDHSKPTREKLRSTILDMLANSY